MNVMMTGRRRCALALLLAALVLEGLLAEQVDIHRGAVIQLCGHNTGADGGAEADLHILKDLEIVGVFQIALGHEHHGGLAVLAGQLERLFCAHGNTAAAGHAHQHALGGADALVLACFKVEQTRCIDQVVLDALVLHRHNGSRQAGLALCFLGIKVRNRGAVLDPAHTLGSARKIDQRLGERGLAAGDDLSKACRCGHGGGGGVDRHISRQRGILDAHGQLSARVSGLLALGIIDHIAGCGGRPLVVGGGDGFFIKKGDVDRAVRHRIGSVVEGDGGDVAREKLVSDRDIAFNDLSRRSGDFLPFDRHLVLDR